MTVTSLLMQSAVKTLWLQLCLTPHWAHSQVRSQVGVGSSKGRQPRGAPALPLMGGGFVGWYRVTLLPSGALALEAHGGWGCW